MQCTPSLQKHHVRFKHSTCIYFLNEVCKVCMIEQVIHENKYNGIFLAAKNTPTTKYTKVIIL